jgi:hypothetical protein
MSSQNERDDIDLPDETEEEQTGTQLPPKEPELHSPLVPLLWLLIPFVAVILYGLFSG